MSLGFQNAGFRIIGGVDHMDIFRRTYEENIGAPFMDADISELSSEEITDYFNIDPKEIDVVIGGPPCQGFSISNPYRCVNDERNSLVFDFMRLIGRLQPSVFVMENVVGLLSMKNGNVVYHIRQKFSEINYRTSEASILNSADYGVPQIRKRAFIIGTNCNGDYLEFPRPTHAEESSQTFFMGSLIPVNLQPWVTLSDALGDLPRLKSGEEKYHYKSEPKTPYQKLMRKTNPPLTNHRAPDHSQSVIDKISDTEQGNAIYSSFGQKKRQEWNAPSPTLCASARPNYHLAHPFDDRGLTVRERARIQSFPDDYVFYSNIVKQRQQTGNAVPPLLAQKIAVKLIDKLKKEKQK